MWNQEQQILQAKLSGSERLLWFGRPRQGFFFRKSDALVIPFSLMWGGFAVFWNAGVWASDAPVFFRLWGLPFLLVGFYMIFGRFIVDILQRKKMHYGITNERIIIISGLFNQETKSIDLNGLTEITFDEKSNGSGTITFGRDETDNSDSWFRSNQNKTVSAPNFEQIPSVKNVYEIIRNAQKLIR